MALNFILCFILLTLNFILGALYFNLGTLNFILGTLNFILGNLYFILGYVNYMASYHDIDCCDSTLGADRLLYKYQIDREYITELMLKNPQQLTEIIWKRGPFRKLGSHQF